MTSKMLVEWQGIFENLNNVSTDILKTRHPTGNEGCVAAVVDSVMHSTFFKKYLNIDGTIPAEVLKEAKEILKLFIANTNFKSNSLSQVQEYSHLINTIPLITKCILAHIIIIVDLTKVFCELLLNLPTELIIEMLNEITLYLTFSITNNVLELTFEYLKTIIRIVGNLNEEDSLLINKLEINFKELMKNMVPSEYSDELSESEETKHLQSYGYVILHLFRLIQECSMENNKTEIFLTILVNTCDSILNVITLDAYASWEEVLVGELSLQDMIAIEAYEVKNQLKNYDPAKEMLIKIIASRSREEVIRNAMKIADIPTIIKNINKLDEYQKLWFQTLLKNENVFDDADSLNCLSTWMKTCTVEDVTIFMAHNKRNENCSNQSLIVECIKILNIADIKLLIQDHYRKHNADDIFLHVNNNNVQLNSLLNKITDTDEVEENVMKDIYVLLLLNPQLTLKMFCDRCLRNSVFIKGLGSLFMFIKSVPKVAACFKRILNNALQSNPISAINYNNYSDFIKLMLELKHFSKYHVITYILLPQVDKLHIDQNNDLLHMVLQLLNNLCDDIEDIPEVLIIELIKIIDGSRTTCIEFSFIKQYNVGVAIELILKLNPNIRPIARSYFSDLFSILERQHKLTKYYCDLVNGNTEKTFFEVCFNSLADIHSMVAPLFVILTQCVATEWKLIIEYIQSRLQNDIVDILQMLTYTLQIHCEYSATLSNYSLRTNNLKWCLDQYLIIIKDVFQPGTNSKEDECSITKYVLYLLAYLDQNFRSNGLKFVDLLPAENFRALKRDKKIAFLLLTFKDEVVAEIIANKMLH